MSSVKYPSNEKVWASFYNAEHKLLFIVTSKISSRDTYFLYELLDGQFKKLGKSKSPLELEEKFHIREKVKAK